MGSEFENRTCYPRIEPDPLYSERRREKVEVLKEGRGTAAHQLS